MDTFFRMQRPPQGLWNFFSNFAGMIIELVTEWTLNRSAQAAISIELKNVAGMEDTNNI